MSGEELLARLGPRRTAQETDGLIAVDVVALADLLRITGPVDVPTYGTLDAGNFTQKMVGDYDAFPDNEARHDLNRAIVPVFAERVLEPGDGIAKIESLRDSARGRHFALWMRDPDLQAAVADIGLAGELSDTDHDYVARLQPEHQRQQVRLLAATRASPATSSSREDGSAQGRASPSRCTTTRRPTPTRASATRSGGTLRHPLERHDARASSCPTAPRSPRPRPPATPPGTDVFDYYGRPYKLLRLTLPPGETRQAVLEYDVPAAAVAPGDGTITYRLDAAPQGLIIPETLDGDRAVAEGLRRVRPARGLDPVGPRRGVVRGPRAC